MTFFMYSIIESAFVGPYSAIGFILLQAGILAARSAKMHKEFNS